jgi:hypothetical protein
MNFPRIDNLIEQWATLYTAISHNPARGSKQKRFFRFNSLPENQELGTKFNTATTPLAGVVTQFDGVSSGKFLQLTVVVYVFTKQAAAVSNTSDNELTATDAKIYGAEILNDLWTWLGEKKKQASGNPKSEDYWMRGMNLDQIQICSEDRHYNGWWPTFLMLKVDVPRQTCSDKTKYREE